MRFVHVVQARAVPPEPVETKVFNAFLGRFEIVYRRTLVDQPLVRDLWTGQDRYGK